MINQGLVLKQSQKLSPLIIQTTKMIELPAQELAQRILKEMEENPMLETDNGSSEEVSDSGVISIDEFKDDSIPAYKLRASNWGKDTRPEYNTFSVKESFTQNLLDQLGCLDLNETDMQIASYLVCSLDSSGYLRRDLDSLVDDIAFRAGIDTDRQTVERLLRVIQGLDPVGVGARDLRECLLLQLGASAGTPGNINARRILTECFDDFTNRHFDRVTSVLGISNDELKDAVNHIRRLNPYPGGEGPSDAGEEQASQIVPDFIMENNDGEISFSMPKYNVPELRINRRYADMLENAATGKEKSEAAAFVKQKMDSAKLFIEAIRQRQITLRKTMQAIIDYQHDFFVDGDEASLKPMILENIATVTGFDISTVSRVVNSKYIETPYGIYQLKFFFSEGLVNNEGETVSTREIKKVLREIIDAEDKNKPLKDEQLVAELSNRGYKVARRTVAKYRDQLGIPLARWRKEL